MPQSLPDDWISAYLDDELTADQKQRAEQLLATDKRHARLLDELRQMRNDLQSLPRYELKNDLSEKVVESARKAIESARQDGASVDQLNADILETDIRRNIEKQPERKLNTKSNQGYWRNSGSQLRYAIASIVGLAALLLVSLAYLPNMSITTRGMAEANSDEMEARKAENNSDELSVESNTLAQPYSAESTKAFGAVQSDPFGNMDLSEKSLEKKYEDRAGGAESERPQAADGESAGGSDRNVDGQDRNRYKFHGDARNSQENGTQDRGAGQSVQAGQGIAQDKIANAAEGLIANPKDGDFKNRRDQKMGEDEISQSERSMENRALGSVQSDGGAAKDQDAGDADKDSEDGRARRNRGSNSDDAMERLKEQSNADGLESNSAQADGASAESANAGGANAGGSRLESSRSSRSGAGRDDVENDAPPTEGMADQQRDRSQLGAGGSSEKEMAKNESEKQGISDGANAAESSGDADSKGMNDDSADGGLESKHDNPVRENIAPGSRTRGSGARGGRPVPDGKSSEADSMQSIRKKATDLDKSIKALQAQVQPDPSIAVNGVQANGPGLADRTQFMPTMKIAMVNIYEDEFSVDRMKAAFSKCKIDFDTGQTETLVDGEFGNKMSDSNLPTAIVVEATEEQLLRALQTIAIDGQVPTIDLFSASREFYYRANNVTEFSETAPDQTGSSRDSETIMSRSMNGKTLEGGQANSAVVRGIAVPVQVVEQIKEQAKGMAKLGDAQSEELRRGEGGVKQSAGLGGYGAGGAGGGGLAGSADGAKSMALKDQLDKKSIDQAQHKVQNEAQHQAQNKGKDRVIDPTKQSERQDIENQKQGKQKNDDVKTVVGDEAGNKASNKANIKDDASTKRSDGVASDLPGKVLPGNTKPGKTDQGATNKSGADQSKANKSAIANKANQQDSKPDSAAQSGSERAGPGESNPNRGRFDKDTKIVPSTGESELRFGQQMNDSSRRIAGEQKIVRYYLLLNKVPRSLAGKVKPSAKPVPPAAEDAGK